MRRSWDGPGHGSRAEGEGGMERERTGQGRLPLTQGDRSSEGTLREGAKRWDKASEGRGGEAPEGRVSWGKRADSGWA